MAEHTEFPVFDLDLWIRGERDTVGNLPKRWFHEDPDSVGWLFKPRTEKLLPLSKARQLAGDLPDRAVGGQDWAEKIAAEVAVELGVPAVLTELATATRLTDDYLQHGSMSRDMRPRDWESAPGAQLLAERDDQFDSSSGAGHSLRAVRAVLAGAAGPPRSPYEQWDAFDIFVGYLIFDAWIGNTDRHAHNWSVLHEPGSAAAAPRLAPSYDHGRAFGSGLDPADHARRVDNGLVEQWCRKGSTSRFDGGRKRNLVDLANAAMRLAGADAQRHWIHCLQTVDLEVCDALVAAVPNLSDPVRSFVMTVLTTNRRRLIDALD